MLLYYKIALFLKLIIREFKSQKLRMALTVLAIAWGTIAITLLMAFTVGLSHQFEKAAAGLGKSVVIIWPGQTTLPYQGLPQGRRIVFKPEDLDLIKERTHGIDLISGEYQRWGVTLQYGKKQVNKMVAGVYPEFKDLRSHFPQAGGRFINKIDFEDKKRALFLGSKVKTELFGEQNAIGEMVLINSIPFTVVGVLIEKMQDSNYHGSDDNYAVIPASTFVMIFGDPYFDDIVYSVKEGIKTKEVEAELFRILGAKYRFDPKDSHTIWIWDTVKEAETTKKVFFGIEIFMWFIGGMTLVIAGVGVANIMYVAIRERTREIGTKMALGAKKRHIVLQFMIEAMFISFLGGAIGLLFSFVVTRLFWLLPMEGALEFLGRPLVNWPVAIITVATLSVIGFMAGFFPARKAASINPVEALRYE